MNTSLITTDNVLANLAGASPTHPRTAPPPQKSGSKPIACDELRPVESRRTAKSCNTPVSGSERPSKKSTENFGDALRDKTVQASDCRHESVEVDSTQPRGGQVRTKHAAMKAVGPTLAKAKPGFKSPPNIDLSKQNDAVTADRLTVAGTEILINPILSSAAPLQGQPSVVPALALESSTSGTGEPVTLTPNAKESPSAGSKLTGGATQPLAARIPKVWTDGSTETDTSEQSTKSPTTDVKVTGKAPVHPPSGQGLMNQPVAALEAARPTGVKSAIAADQESAVLGLTPLATSRKAAVPYEGPETVQVKQVLPKPASSGIEQEKPLSVPEQASENRPESSPKLTVFNGHRQSAQTQSVEVVQNVPTSPDKPPQGREEPANTRPVAGQIAHEALNADAKGQSDNRRNSALLEKLDAQRVPQNETTESRVSGGQTKDGVNVASDNGPKVSFEQIFSSHNAQTPALEQTAVSTQATKAANPQDQTPPGDTPKTVGEQILESVRGSLGQAEGGRHIIIRLNPPELGRVSMRFEEQEGQIVGILEASKQQTRNEIERALPQIVQNLQNSGIQVRRLQATLTSEQGHQGLREQSFAEGQSGFSWQHESNNRGQQSGSASYPAEWMADDTGYLESRDYQDMALTGDSINMLV